ncbi:glycosyltransferase [Salimicrobium album]|uniref:Glycosyltransferase involved in cell wall bisynthesis n=1 Tax=Salimicrobium album TaxID=50717 RepID=A0A1H3EK87_9BACI|nr:glycosyltransferase [Salimicrobium album]SDX79182.1 Glycosyltransferase involved in cell wall bisynthesis [Salimicrobium album]
MKTKVLFFMQSLGGGGAERTVINIINNLNRNNFIITLVVGNYSSNVYSDYLKKDVKVIDLETNRLRYSVMRLRKTIINERPDIIFTTVNHNNIITSLVTGLIIKNRPKLIVREAAVRSESKKVTTKNKILTKICYNNFANGVIALSNGVKDDMINNFGVKSDKIQVIYNPVDIDSIEQLKNEPVNDEEAFGENEKKIISVGRLVEAKDYPTLLRAFKIVCQKYKAKLIIAGVGHLEEELKQLAVNLNIHDYVVFKGFIKNPYNYMNKADVFVLTSKWEGFGHVIVEAMASGVPVVSTNCNSGPKEIITHNLNGKLVGVDDYKRLAEVIKETLEHDNSEIIRNAKIRTKDFNAVNIVKEYESYFKLLDNTKNG